MKPANSDQKPVRSKSKFSPAPYLMAAPAMLFLFVFTFYPMLNLFYLSFFDYNMVSEKKFIGLENYRTLFFVKKDFLIALRNTAVYTAAVVFFLLLLATLFALLLEKDSRINRLLQRSMFTPHLTAVLSCAYVWMWIFNPDAGLLNAVFKFFGLPVLRWINSSDTAMICVVIVSVWKSVGYYLIIVLSSLRSIPPEIFEAASLDNTGRIRKFFKITLPMISPQLFFLLITITIHSFKVFDTIRVMTDGGPGDATNVLVMYIYKYAFAMNMKVGYASAAGSVLMVILMALTAVYFRVVGRKVHYQ